MQTAFMGLTDFALAVSEGRRALAALAAEPHPPLPRIVDIQLNTADVLEDLGRLDEAERLLHAVAGTLKDHTIAGTELEVRYWRETALLAAVKLDVPGYLAGMQIATRLAKTVPGLSQPLGDHLAFGLADAYRLSGRLPQAEALFRDVVHRETAEYGADDARPNFATVALASVLGFEKRLDEAHALLRVAISVIEHAVGPDASRTLEAKSTLAAIDDDQGDVDAAVRLWTQVAASYARSKGQGNLDYLDTQSSIGIALLHGGRVALAASLFRRTLDQARAALPSDSPEIQSLRYYLAWCLLAHRRPDEVPALLDGLQPGILNMVELAPGWDLRLACASGWLALQQGDLPRARASLADATRLQRLHPDDRLVTAPVLQALARQASGADPAP